MRKPADIIELVQQDSTPPSLPSIDLVQRELDRIVRSKTFRRARRLKHLLEYVVTAALNGQTGGQKQTARELFGKNEDFDPSLDPVIRVQFGRLRRALANYYAAEGKSDPIVIEIPNRRFTPVFRSAPAAGAEPSPNPAAGDTVPLIARNGLQPVQSAARTGGGSSDPERPLIAVLPFANLTSDPEQDSFCYGLTEEIANGLASIASVDVVASSSSFQFKDEHVDVREVGRELGVPLVLEGSVRMEEGHTRVIAQLARSNDGVAVWSDSFDDTMNGSLNTQKSIAQKVMENMPLASPEA